MRDVAGCVKKLYVRGWLRPCSRRGVVVRGEKAYCRQHDPERVRARREKQESKYEALRKEDEKNKRDMEAMAKTLGYGRPHFHHSFVARTTSGWSRALVIEEADVVRLCEELEEGRSRAQEDARRSRG